MCGSHCPGKCGIVPTVSELLVLPVQTPNSEKSAEQSKPYMLKNHPNSSTHAHHMLAGAPLAPLQNTHRPMAAARSRNIQSCGCDGKTSHPTKTTRTVAGARSANVVSNSIPNPLQRQDVETTRARAEKANRVARPRHCDGGLYSRSEIKEI